MDAFVVCQLPIASTGSATEDSMIIIDYRYRGTHNHRSPIEPPSDMSVLKIQVRKIKSKILVTCKILDFPFFRVRPKLRSCFELFVWRLRASSFPAAHLGNPNKFDCPRFGRWVESEKLQFRPLLPRKIAVLSDWRSGKKMKIFHLKEHFKQFKTASQLWLKILNIQLYS